MTDFLPEDPPEPAPDEFDYSEMLPLDATGPDETPYRLLTTDGVSTFEAGGHDVPAGRARGAHRC